MTIQILSDIHPRNWTEAHGSRWFRETFISSTRTNADVLIIAGDTVSMMESQLEQTKETLKVFCDNWKNVVYVLGNHDCWGTSINTAEERLSELGVADNFHPLVNGEVRTIEGQRFFGATGFQPRPRKGVYVEHIIDSEYIRQFYRQAPRHFLSFIRFLDMNLTKDDIVVTHHAPSARSTSPEFIGSPSNHYFITPQFEDTIRAKQPKLWVHGHVHSCHDYSIENTRVICNPLGYAGEGVNFANQLVIEP